MDEDTLTGAGTRSALVDQVNREVLRRSPSPFVARFLCVDVDNLKAFMDVAGLLRGDAALLALGRGLLARYGAGAVFRVDGDDFVVDLGDRAAWVPEVEGVVIKHAVLEVAVVRHPARNHHLCKWIMLHLDEASLLAKVGGVTLACGDPPAI